MFQPGRRDVPTNLFKNLIKPELPDELYGLITAFFDLSTCRQLGMETVGGIPYTAMLTWVDRWCDDNNTKEMYLDIIPQLDNIYLEHVHSKREQSSGGLKRHRTKP